MPGSAIGHHVSSMARRQQSLCKRFRSDLLMATRGLTHFRLFNAAGKALKRGDTDAVLRMLDDGLQDDWSDKTIGMVVMQLRPHVNERIAEHLERMIEAGCGPFARGAIAAVLGRCETTAGRRVLRRLVEDSDNKVAHHATMSFEELRRR